MPEDIYPSLWTQVSDVILSGHIATTQEIYEEMCHIPGQFGDLIIKNRELIVLEVADITWDYRGYIEINKFLCTKYRNYISEYISLGSENTICLNDMTVVALAKCLGLPLISMEKSASNSTKRKRIPDICALENITHYDFNGFLKAAGIRI